MHVVAMDCSMNAMDILEMLCMLTLTQITAHRCEDVLYLSDSLPPLLSSLEQDLGLRLRVSLRLTEVSSLMISISWYLEAPRIMIPATSCFFTESLCDVTFLKTLAHQFLPSALAQGFVYSRNVRTCLSIYAHLHSHACSGTLVSHGA